MKRLNTVLVILAVAIAACVQPPVFTDDSYALIRSNNPIVNINDVAIEPSYRRELEAGENTVIIVYRTYQHDYFCTFSWTAAANTVYEVTNQENRYPLTLFRWVRTNSLWASRLDPADPVDCIRKTRGDSEPLSQ